MICIDCVGRVSNRFRWYAHQISIDWIDGQSSRQVWHDLVGQATASIVRWYTWYHRVVHCNNCCRRTKWSQVRTCNTDWRNSVWTITDSIIVSIWVAWVSTCVVCIKIQSSIGFSCIVVAITVIVQVFCQTRCADWVVDFIVVNRQNVRHTVTIQVF